MFTFFGYVGTSCVELEHANKIPGELYIKGHTDGGGLNRVHTHTHDKGHINR